MALNLANASGAVPVSLIGDRALTIKEAAAWLRVSCWTLYDNPQRYGFVKVGRVWRVWPETLRERLQAYNPPPTGAGGKENEICQSVGAKDRMSGLSISARQAEVELDALLKQPIGRRRRSTTTN
ncbi:hypothetical protein AB3X91_24465 [Paraburkholderia sp. BR14263]|uniref:hypothetical protein n=1 Tax=unclassified Paraburkholderia TaxID=2615204 RepID=UPI0034CD3907